MNLYLIVLGGNIKGANIEVHDVRLAVGKSIKATLRTLKSEWIGKAEGLHIDSYKLIRYVDGYKISVVDKSVTTKKEINKLWLINLGGYKDGQMLEQHHIELVVAESAKTAKRKAIKKWAEDIKQIHKDDIIPISTVQEYSIYLRPDPKGINSDMLPDWSGYWLIS